MLNCTYKESTTMATCAYKYLLELLLRIIALAVPHEDNLSVVERNWCASE